MESSKNNLILQRALEKGIIAPEDIEEASKYFMESEESNHIVQEWGPWIATLIRLGKLKEETVIALQQELASSLDTRVTDSDRNQTESLMRQIDNLESDQNKSSNSQPIPQPPSTCNFPLTTDHLAPSTSNEAMEAEHPAREILETPLGKRRYIGHYEIEEMLGSGGMGQVFKAFDHTLNRHVALKFLKSDKGDLLKRFLKEARAQAQVDHEYVCRVYEVGEIESKTFIAMQYISGKTLGDASGEMTLEQKVKLMAQVAEALHAAHRQGLIHRDIKPANIMVEHTEEGYFKPYIMDFGLARESKKTEGLTESGTVVGTPFYMAPEQVRGDVHALDRRTDVYSLGVTLYELLTGKLPFESTSSIDVMMKILQEEPRPLRKIDERLPVDLETIVMKCLEKEPQRRYESARALGEDLRRYLDGEPIMAHPRSMVYRIYKKSQKHRSTVFALAVAFVVVMTAAAYGIYIRWTANEQSKFAQQLGQEIEKIDSYIYRTYSLPLHDTRQEKAQVKAMIGDIQKLSKKSSYAKGPSAYAIGRSYLALNNLDDAQHYLQEAWQIGYHQPEVAYALGQVMGAQYQRALADVETEPNKEKREELKSEKEHMYREPALKYLKQSKGMYTASPEYVEALIAYHEKRYDEALKKAKSAYERILSLYEARKLEGDIYADIANMKRQSGFYKEALTFYTRSEKSYRSASEIGRSDANVYDSICNLALIMMNLKYYELGEDIEQTFISGLEACQQALHADPSDFNAYILLSGLYSQMGGLQTDRGTDPRLNLANAVNTAQKALSIQDDVRAYRCIGSAYLDQISYALDRGFDPRTSIKSAEEALLKAASLDPHFAETFNTLGILYDYKAYYEHISGQDPKDSYAKALQAYNTFIKLNPNSASPYSNLGGSYAGKASYELENGLNPADSIQNALKAYQKAIAINPHHSYGYSNMAEAYIYQSTYEYLLGQDPHETIKKSIEINREAIKINPKNPFAYHYIALAFWMQTRYEIEHIISSKNGSDFSPALSIQKGLYAIDQMLHINPEDPASYCILSLLHLSAGQLQMLHHQNPAVSFMNARKFLNKGFQINQNYADLYLINGQLSLRETEWRISQKLSSAQEIQKGLTAFKNALTINPRMAEAWAWQSKLLSLQSETAKDATQKRRLLNQSQESLKKALSINKNLARLFS